ncbi:MAG: C25 family cysteine peptidase [Acidobacteriota bacterium]
MSKRFGRLMKRISTATAAFKITRIISLTIGLSLSVGSGAWLIPLRVSQAQVGSDARLYLDTSQSPVSDPAQQPTGTAKKPKPQTKAKRNRYQTVAHSRRPMLSKKMLSGIRLRMNQQLMAQKTSAKSPDNGYQRPSVKDQMATNAPQRGSSASGVGGVRRSSPLLIFPKSTSRFSIAKAPGVLKTDDELAAEKLKAQSEPQLTASGEVIEARSYDIEPVKPSEFNGDVRNLPSVPSGERLGRELEGPTPTKKAPENPPDVETPTIPLAPMPSPTVNFAGLSFNSSVIGGQAGAGWPPDINGDVGSSHYIMAVNNAYAIYNKTGTQLAAFTENSLWSGQGIGTPCAANNQGDPVVIYDQFADRWILTHFAFQVVGAALVGPYYQCFAVSKTNDPVSGGWWFYAVRMDTGASGQPPINALADYAKFGNWNDGCLYMGANMFGSNGNIYSGIAFASLNKSDMYSGATLRGALGFISGNTNFSVFPSNISGAKLPASLPPAGTPNYFVGESVTDFTFEVRKFTPGANCQGGTMSGITSVTQTAYNFNLPNVPQPNTTNTLDTVGDRIMQKVQYRRVGSAESLWVVHNVNVSGSTNRIQWAQINVTGGTIVTTSVQQQIYAPDTTLHRWMGSIAADNQGNMAVGYSTSNGTSPNFPSIAYSGRLAGDPLNTLPQTEVQLVAGAGSQTNNCGGAPCHRWGDYTAMSIDPVDDCTFWYTNMYYINQTNGSSGNWNTRVGAFKFPGCTAPTVAKVRSFTAKGFDDGQVLLQWQSDYEVDNLGFNVYREVNGQRTKITHSIIAGSALTAGAGVEMKSGRVYAWKDQLTGVDGKVSYWLEDLDLNGKHTLTGPIAISENRGARPTTEQSKLLVSLGQPQEQMNFAQGSNPIERLAQPVTVTPAMIQTQSGLANNRAVKIGVRHEGWYRLTPGELAAAGLDTNADPRKLQLFVDGQPVPFLVKGELDGRLDASDTIEFYGLGLDNTVTNERVYWLVNGATTGARIKSAKISGGVAGTTRFQSAVEHKDRTLYFSALKNGEAENFFGALINSTGVDQTLNLTNLATSPTGTATLGVNVQGVTNTAHQVQVLLNGKAVGTLTFNGQAAATQSINLPQAGLNQGSNQVRLVALGGSADISLVDKITLTYWRKYAAESNQLRCTASGGEQITLTGFTSTDIRVLDVTNPNNPQELTGTLSGSKNAATITLTVAGAGTRQLYAFTGEQARSVMPKTNQPSNWRQNNRSADYLIITRRELQQSFEPLAAFRRSKGLTVAMVDVEDLYDEFNFGNQSPQAIKDFLAFTKSNWAVAPRYVLLGGDGTYDYKNYLGFGDDNIVPTKLIDTQYMETASDDWFVDFSNQGLPEMAIGRLPARNASEAARLVAKIISYDNQTAANQLLLVSDLTDGFDFSNGNNELRPLVPTNLAVTEIKRGTADDATLHKELIEAINSGLKVVNYSGHGSLSVWRGGLLSNEDASALINNQNLALFVSMNCLNGYYVNPEIDSLAERLLNAQGGACAIWASSGLCEPGGQAQLNKEFYRQLFGSTPMTLGEAAMRAKAFIADPDIRKTWTLLGDPAMQLR